MYTITASFLFVLAALSQASLHDDTGKIIYPTGKKTYEMPASCTAKTYCFDKGPDYPQDTINQLVKELEEKVVISPESPEIIIGPRAGEEPECPYQVSSEPIHYIIDQNNETRVVVQATNFTQIYTARWCQKEGRITWDTTHFLKETVSNYDIECVNTKMDFQFIVLNDSFHPALEIVKVKDGIPIYCECIVN